MSRGANISVVRIGERVPKAIEREVIAYGPQPDQHGELFRPTQPGNTGTVVIIHGGFWKSQHRADLGVPLAMDLASRGWTAWNIEYRRVGGGGGWPETFDDVAAALDAIATFGLDLSRVVGVGHSAGGHLATWLAGRGRLPGSGGAPPQVRLTGVVAQAGVLDLAGAARDRLGGGAVEALIDSTIEDAPAVYRSADPLSAAPLEVPVVCIHSRLDDTVPFSQSETYVETSAGRGGAAMLVEVPGGHMAHVDPSSHAWAAARDAIARLTSTG